MVQRKKASGRKSQSGKGAGSTAVRRKTVPAKRKAVAVSRKVYKAVPQGYMFVQNGNGLWSMLKKGASALKSAATSKVGKAFVKGSLDLLAKHGPASVREKASTAQNVLGQIGYGSSRVITRMPAGCSMVQRGDGFFDFVKKAGRSIGKALTSKAGRSIVKGGLDLAAQYGPPRVKAGAMATRAVLDQAGYGYSYVPAPYPSVLTRSALGR